MKERSLAERIVAILGVLLGSVAWVARLLGSMLKGVLGNVVNRGDSSQQAESGRAATSDDSGAIPDLDDDAESLSFSHTEASPPTLTKDQHSGMGGVPPAPKMEDVAAANLSSMGSISDEQSTPDLDVDETTEETETSRLSHGIPNLEEPGGDDDTDVVSRAGDVLEDDRPVDEYAGQVVSESDIGVEREDDTSLIADSPDNDLDAGVDAYDLVDAGDTGYDEDETDRDEGVPAASRGWEENADDPLANDPLYGEPESSEVGDEVDLRNDEATDSSGSGMHVVDSPDEPFLEEEPSANVLDLDSMTGDLPEVDDVTNREAAAIDENLLAADSTGSRIGGDPASGDLGGDTSFGSTERDPGESREPGDTMGANTGSGVDPFASDAIAADMLDDVESMSGDSMDDTGSAPGQGSEQTDSDEATESAAWASSAGVVDTELTRPTGADELLSDDADAQPRDDGEDGPGGPGSGEAVFDDFATDGSPSDAVKAPQYDPEDAGLRDVAAEVAEDIDIDGPEETAGTPGDAGREVRDRGSDSVDTQASGRKSDGPAGSVRGDGSPSCPAGYPIKGNARSRIYHTPSDTSYEGTVPEFCFATEEDARTAGFRPRKS